MQCRWSVTTPQVISDSDFAFIILIISMVYLIPINMNSKEILLKEMFSKVGDTISEQTVSEKVGQFVKYGNVFLLFEIMNLRKEIEKIKEEMQSIKGMIEAEKLQVSL